MWEARCRYKSLVRTFCSKSKEKRFIEHNIETIINFKSLQSIKKLNIHVEEGREEIDPIGTMRKS